MSNELLQTIAAITTLVVIVIGVTVAISELRQEVLARRLQGLSALFAEVWPEEASKAAFAVASVGPGFDDADITPEQRGAAFVLMAPTTTASGSCSGKASSKSAKPSPIHRSGSSPRNSGPPGMATSVACLFGVPISEPSPSGGSISPSVPRPTGGTKAAP